MTATYCQRLFLVRHAERAELSDLSWYTGPGAKQLPTDGQITIRGMLQAKDVGRFLNNHDIRHIYSSPFMRAIQTSHYISEQTKNAEINEQLHVKVEQGFAECLTADFTGNKNLNPLRYLVPVEYLRASIGVEIDRDYQSVITPEYPETLPTMTERVQKALWKVLKAVDTEAVLIVTHSSVIEAIVSALSPGSLFPRGIPLASVTELHIQRNLNLDRDTISARIVRMANDEFIRAKADYELGFIKPRFGKRPFPPMMLLGDCLAPEFDAYEDRMFATTRGEEGEDGEVEQTTRNENVQVEQREERSVRVPERIKIDPLKERFLKLLGDDAELPFTTAVFIAYHRGDVPSMVDIANARQKYGDTLTYEKYLAFLDMLKTDRPQVDELVSFFAAYDPSSRGRISTTTFVNLLTTFGFKLPESSRSAILKSIGVAETDSHVQYREAIEKLVNVDVLPLKAEPTGWRTVGNEMDQDVEQEEHEEVVHVEAVFNELSEGNSVISWDSVLSLLERIGRRAHNKDISDSGAAPNSELTLEEVNNFIEFIGKRQDTFGELARRDGTISIESAASLMPQFGVVGTIRKHDFAALQQANTDSVDYSDFLVLCSRKQYRHLAFLVVSLATGRDGNSVSSNEVRMLAKNMGYVEEVNPNQDLYTFEEFMEYVDNLYSQHIEANQNQEEPNQFYSRHTDVVVDFFESNNIHRFISKSAFHDFLALFGQSCDDAKINEFAGDMIDQSDMIDYYQFIIRVMESSSNVEETLVEVVDKSGDADMAVLEAVASG